MRGFWRLWGYFASHAQKGLRFGHRRCQTTARVSFRCPRTNAEGMSLASSTNAEIRHANLEIRQRICREALVWASAQHNNVLEFLGFHFTIQDNTFTAWLVCPWMENGNVREYLDKRRWEIVERLKLVRAPFPPF